MEINKENYEAYLLDLWEGNLSQEQEILLSRFLKEHPELDDEDSLNIVSDISNTRSKEVFDKDSIHFEEINIKNHEYFFIAYFEGDLSKEEMILVDQFLIQHPTLKLKFTQFNKAKLPIETIANPNKEKLLIGKSKVISIQSKRWIIGLVAASILFLLYLRIPVLNSNSKYSMSKYEKLEIEMHDDVSNDTAHGVNRQIDFNSTLDKSEQLITSNSESDKNLKSGSLNNSNNSSSSTPHNLTAEIAPDLERNEKRDNHLNNKKEIISHLRQKKSSDAIASIVLTQRSTEKSAEDPIEQVKDKIPTIIDVTADYLQERNVLTEEKKPNFKGLVNSFSDINSNKKPIILIEEEEKTKTTILQLGPLKIERKRKK